MFGSSTAVFLFFDVSYNASLFSPISFTVLITSKSKNTEMPRNIAKRINGNAREAKIIVAIISVEI